MDTLESRPVLDLTEQLASSVALAYRIHLNTSNLLATTMTQTGAIEIIRQLFKGYAGGNISHRERAEIGNSTTLESEPLALNEADAATFSNFIPGYVQWEAISKSGQETIIKRLRAYKKSIFRNQ